MYSVLLADNQPDAAETAELLGRAAHWVEIVGRAHSGRDAIEKAFQLRPDIIILELSLHGIGGLETIRQIRQSGAEIRFIIVTELNYFNYAAEAMSLGADEYLLKPLSETELLDALGRTARKIDLRRDALSQTLTLKEKLETATRMLENSFLGTICLPDGHNDELEEYLWLFDCSKNEVFIAAIEFFERDDARGKSSHDEIRKLRPVFRDILRSMCDCLVGAAMQSRLAVLVFADAAGRADQRLNASRLMKTFMGRVESITPHVVAGIGSQVEGRSFKQVQKSWREALYALGRVPRRHGECLHIDDLSQGAAVCGEPADSALDDKPQKSNEIIEKADRYMQTHYHTEISLENIAKICALSPFYFSHFYKQETGMNFTQKLLHIRLQKAKELLAFYDMPIKEISAAAGYEDPNYFCKIFKKTTGLTPSEYKKRMGAKHGTSIILPQDYTNNGM